MEWWKTITSLWEQWGLLGIGVFGIGILAWMNRRAQLAHEKHCDERYDAFQDHREADKKEIRELITERTKEIYARMDHIDERSADRRERDKGEILRAINDRRIEEQGDMFVNALGKAVSALRRKDGKEDTP